MTVISPATASAPTAPALPYGENRRGRSASADPRWTRPALLSLLAATALLYIVNLSASGYSNAFYSAAVQAGTTSWKAFFFGSFDGGNAITVDKPPAALWVQEIAARIFGVNSWSLLVPEALMGVAAVALIYATVKRRFNAAAGLLAGGVLALTPVATLMFRFNNPDALMVLLLVASAYALTRALEAGRTRWTLLCGALIGFAFLAKMLQAFLVVPGFALVYLVAAPKSLGRRIVQVIYGGIAMLVAAGWWVAIVTAWPTSDRPYIGGSQNNSILNLIFGYNGLGRISGNETGSVGGGGGGGAAGGGMWGITGWTRMFNAEIGGQVSWLIPTALIFTAGLLWMSRRVPRTDGRRAQVLIWATWLLATGLIFSFMAGIFHQYYTVALAPAIGALVGIGGVSLWQYRHRLTARLFLAGGVAAAAIWSYELLHRTSSWNPWLRFVVLLGGLAVAGWLAVRPRMSRVIAVAAASVAISIGLAGPFAYSVATASTGKSGSIPTAGPTVAGSGPGVRGGFGGMRPAAGQAQAQGGVGGFPGGAAATGRGGFGPGPTGAGGGMGGLLDASTPSAALKTLLTANAGQYTWIAATIGSNNAAGIQLATGKAVMAIGGFNGTDPSPTLAQFQQWVSEGKVHYFVAGGGFGGGFGGVGGGGGGTGNAISSWVEQHFTARTVGGQTVYDLTASTSGTQT
jgi:4-amino-4-deoxy-L-arabinose transferase-like glycosyltransferase